MKRFHLKNKTFYISNVLKFIAFFLLAIVGYLDLIHSEHTIFEDPLCLGAAAVAIASLLMITLNNDVNYVHIALFFYIFTKIISQITHSKHYTILGHHR